MTLRLTEKGRRALDYKPGGPCYEAFTDGMSMGHIHEREGQEYLDGHALRLVKEALPMDAKMLTLTHIPGDDRWGEWEVSAEGPYRCGELEWTAVGQGDTIAEAADRCRERLEAR